MKMLRQVINLALAVVLTTMNLVNCCPLPEDTCSNLPADTFTYTSYLETVPGHPEITLSINASFTDLAFNAHMVSDSIARATVMDDISQGCSDHDFNGSITDIDSTSGELEVTCPFTYRCDYNPQRVPPYVFHARCNSRQLDNGTKCREVFYPIVTLTSESCDPLGDDEELLLQTELVAVSCAAVQ